MSTSSRGNARSTMTLRCQVERDAAGVDVEGNPAAANWQQHIASLACRFWNTTSEREIADGDRIVVGEDLRLLVPVGTDVLERDRVVNVVDRLGASILPGALNIRAVVRRTHHLELTLQGAAAG